MGKFESAALDEDEDDEPPVDRSPSPVPQDPPPPQDKYIRLGTREQFSYVKPVLQAILHNNYVPIRDKVQVFLTGSKKERSTLSEKSSARGLMLPRQVTELMEILKWWCLREEGMVQRKGEEGIEDNGMDVETEEAVPVTLETGPTLVEGQAGNSSALRVPALSPVPTEPLPSPATEPPESICSELTGKSSMVRRLSLHYDYHSHGQIRRQRRPMVLKKMSWMWMCSSMLSQTLSLILLLRLGPLNTRPYRLWKSLMFVTHPASLQALLTFPLSSAAIFSSPRLFARSFSGAQGNEQSQQFSRTKKSRNCLMQAGLCWRSGIGWWTSSTCDAARWSMFSGTTARAKF